MMRHRLRALEMFVVMPVLLIFVGCAGVRPRPVEKVIDEITFPEHEFRALWIATVANIDWPSEPGLPSETQKQEARTILDAAVNTNMNAVIFQVRPQCDALYASEIEPWSYFLSGQQGKAPEPYYDPLEFWIREAHARGLELHVWFNPYRAHHPMGGDVTGTSVVKKHPELVKELKDGYWWLDPSIEGTQDYSIDVIMDVVKRYDVDGVHLDDYFYPYPSYNGGDDFPDDDTWEAYEGKLSRNDWRRDSVNRFVKRLYSSIKKEKRHVKYGMSPFGIWRPYYPETIRGLDQYDVLYADARLWLNEGWVDYFTPQLYWPISRIPQSYPVLLGWWARENHKKRNLWPGLYTSRVSDEKGVYENINQIMVTRGFVPDGPGNVHFSAKAMVQNYAGIADSLKRGPYAFPAVVPNSPWLDNKNPVEPHVRVSGDGMNCTVAWSAGDDERPFRWIVHIKQGDLWRYDVVPGNVSTYRMRVAENVPSPEAKSPSVWVKGPVDSTERVTHVAVSAVDRMGNISDREIIALER